MYDADFFAWSEHQATLLRRFSSGERTNEIIDWPNVIEEIEDLGRSELHSCESLLRQALLHLLKLHIWRASPDVPHWRIEVTGFLFDARRRYTPAMRQRLALDGLYAQAVRQMEASGRLPEAPPATCPFQLGELLASEPNVDALLEELGKAAALVAPVLRRDLDPSA